jgi:hypothetical protein
MPVPLLCFDIQACAYLFPLFEVIYSAGKDNRRHGVTILSSPIGSTLNRVSFYLDVSIPHCYPLFFLAPTKTHPGQGAMGNGSEATWYVICRPGSLQAEVQSA